jgi:hypothetical protein
MSCNRKDCKDCLELKNHNKCFFHNAKNIILNNDVDTIKKWIDVLYNKYELTTKHYECDILFLVTDICPKLLSQREIYKRCNKFIKDIIDYLFEISKKEIIPIYFTAEIVHKYIKNVKLSIKSIENINFNTVKSLFRENHFIYFITKQGLSLEDSIKYCFKETKGKDIHTIINLYRKRDRILWKELYHLPDSIVSIIIKAIG